MATDRVPAVSGWLHTIEHPRVDEPGQDAKWGDWYRYFMGLGQSDAEAEYNADARLYPNAVE